ncbi:MAG: hypothetical protein AAFW75_20570 [Cyanobacteria bacterium J06636_16]
MLAFSRHKQSSPAILSDDFPPESPVTVEYKDKLVKVSIARFLVPEIPLAIYYPQGIHPDDSGSRYLIENPTIAAEYLGALGEVGDSVTPESYPYTVFFWGHAFPYGIVSFSCSRGTTTTADFEEFILQGIELFGAIEILDEYTDPEELQYSWTKKIYLLSTNAGDALFSKRNIYFGEIAGSAFCFDVSGLLSSSLEESDRLLQQFAPIADIILSNLRLRSIEARMR